jgi:hypothetical protein
MAFKRSAVRSRLAPPFFIFFCFFAFRCTQAGSVGEGLAGFSRDQGPLPLFVELAFFTRQRLSSLENIPRHRIFARSPRLAYLGYAAPGRWRESPAPGNVFRPAPAMTAIPQQNHYNLIEAALAITANA